MTLQLVDALVPRVWIFINDASESQKNIMLNYLYLENITLDNDYKLYDTIFTLSCNGFLLISMWLFGRNDSLGPIRLP